MPKFPNIGDLRHRIEIQSAPTPTRTELGETVRAEADWQTTATRCAEFDPFNGREILSNQQIAAEAEVRFRLRYYAGLSPTVHRIRYAGNTYDINAVIDMGGVHRFHEIVCKRKV